MASVAENTTVSGAYSTTMPGHASASDLPSLHGAGFPASLGRLLCEAIDAEGLPPVPRRLLAHRRDMTSTLEAHAGEVMKLVVLDQRRVDDVLAREVVLIGEGSGRPFEIGAIRIHLDRFPERAVPAIVDGRSPLGAILARYAVDYVSRPGGYLAVRATPEMARALGLTSPGSRLYGRHNRLLDHDGGLLAEVVEILPPSP